MDLFSPIPPSSSACGASRGPRLGQAADYAGWVLAQMRPVACEKPDRLASPEYTLPPPLIPSRVGTVHSPEPSTVPLTTKTPLRTPVRDPGWLLSLAIGAGIVAVTLGGAFYAMPSLAGGTVVTTPTPDTAQPSKPIPPPAPAPPSGATEHPLASALEVSGIRFIADSPSRHPQVHYLVVNHSNEPIVGLTVSVNLQSRDGHAPVSHFSFRVPRLEAYESREMINAVDHLNPPAASSDWRQLRAELSLESSPRR